MSALTIFACTFLVVLALSLQSLNVIGGHYALAFGTSIVIGGCNLLLLKLVPQPTGWLENLAFLAGGPFGAITAMRWHPALVRLYRRYQAASPMHADTTP